MRFSKLPAESKAAMLLTVRLSSSLSIGQIWANLGVPSDGPDGDTIPRKSHDADMKIAVWLIWRLLDQKASAQRRLQRNAQSIRFVNGRLDRYMSAYSSAREFQVAHGAALAGIEQQIRRLNAEDCRPLLDRVTELVDCELLRRANNG